MEKEQDVLISWPHSSTVSSVYVAGTFSDWSPLPMMKTTSGRNYEISIPLKPGIYQYKFIVNGEWKHDEYCDVENDDTGGYNNLLLVEATAEGKAYDKSQEKGKGSSSKSEKSQPSQNDGKKNKDVSKKAVKNQAPTAVDSGDTAKEQKTNTSSSSAAKRSVSHVGATKAPLVEPFPDDFKGYYPLQETLLAKLKEKGILPHKDPVVDLNAERPIGHSTHNLFVKDKSKQLFMITHAQHKSAKLNVIAQAIGAKNPRFAPKEDIVGALKVESGCITILSLMGDPAGKVKVVIDKSLLDPAGEKTLRICCGCKDPLKHDQHVIVDVPRDVILELLKETNHGDPILIPFE